MLFKEVIGQQAIKERFIKSVNQNRISHAQMLIGPQGVGKLALAIAYAQYISCKNRKPDDSCGVCASCVKFNNLVHPDLHFVFPVVTTPKNANPISDNFITDWRRMVLNTPYFNINKWLEELKTENKQASIMKGESQEIIRKLNLKSYESEYKTMIIWLPEKMNITAANKLLKMIEEPPPKTLFLLISEEPEQVIKTIISRTQLIKIPLIDNESLLNAINEHFNISPEEANEVLRLARGSFSEVINLLTQNQHNLANEKNESNFEKFTQFMRKSYGGNFSEVIDWIDEIAKSGRERQKQFIVYSLKMIRDNFLLNQAQANLAFLTGQEREFSEKFSPFIKINNVLQITILFDKAHLYIERNVNAKLVFLDLSFKVNSLLRA